MITFSWAEFFAPVTLPALLMSIALGIVMGVMVYGRRRWSLSHLYWLLVMGIVFFVPLSLTRALEGSTTWERFLAVLVLWTTFCVSSAIGPLIVRRRR